ncbi:uncharacterized protein LOC127264092 isoform X1 [Andrographis paniculata]|uniref:uncharacterized protein LOC127264092 isoform X1 n=1 Tax=Andrographis paniculata TaxID=175694 RepID=UPI0021E9482E|nr:uncharacterized protein LOC127264092 isoform X1 [Andrographis paniculata]
MDIPADQTLIDVIIEKLTELRIQSTQLRSDISHIKQQLFLAEEKLSHTDDLFVKLHTLIINNTEIVDLSDVSEREESEEVETSLTKNTQSTQSLEDKTPKVEDKTPKKVRFEEDQTPQENTKDTQDTQGPKIDLRPGSNQPTHTKKISTSEMFEPELPEKPEKILLKESYFKAKAFMEQLPQNPTFKTTNQRGIHPKMTTFVGCDPNFISTYLYFGYIREIYLSVTKFELTFWPELQKLLAPYISKLQVWTIGPDFGNPPFHLFCATTDKAHTAPPEQPNTQPKYDNPNDQYVYFRRAIGLRAVHEQLKRMQNQGYGVLSDGPNYMLCQKATDTKFKSIKIGEMIVRMNNKNFPNDSRTIELWKSAEEKQKQKIIQQGIQARMM